MFKLTYPANARPAHINAPPNTTRSEQILRQIRTNPSTVSLRTHGGHHAWIFETALKDVPLFQSRAFQVMRGGPSPEKILSDAMEKSQKLFCQNLQKKKPNTELKQELRLQCLADINREKPKSILKEAGAFRNQRFDIDLESFSPETVAQFVDYQHGKGLPKDFDAMELFRLADYTQYEQFAKEILFSRIGSHHPTDLRFVVTALTSSDLEFTHEEKAAIDHFIDKNDWEAIVDDWLLYHWTSNENCYSDLFLAESYYNGWGVERDREKAFRYYQFAAYEKNALARSNLGHCYLMGIGTQRDVSKSRSCLRANTAQPHSDGQRFLRTHYGIEPRRSPVFEQILAHPDPITFRAQGGVKIEAHRGAIEGLPFFSKLVPNRSQRLRTRLESDRLEILTVEHPDEIDLEKYSAEIINQFLDWRYGKEFPKNFDAAALYQFANEIQCEKFAKAILISRTTATEPEDHLFLCDALTTTSLQFSLEEKQPIHQYICNYNWKGIVNPSVLKQWIERANHNCFSMVFLGICYQKGFGIKKDSIEAIRYFHLAEKKGDSLGCVYLGICFMDGKKYPEEAFRYISLGAKNGNALGFSALGYCHKAGIGVSKNQELALEKYRISVELGDAYGQACLGVCYEKGLGVKEDIHEAVRLYRLSANQGDSHGQVCLALCLKNGLGVEKNVPEAIRYFRLAVDNGDSDGLLFLGLCYEQGAGVPQDIEMAIQLYRLAAQNKNAKAQLWLGDCYRLGVGTKKDLEKAIVCYRLAADQEEGQAYCQLGIYYEDREDPDSVSEAVRYYTLAASQGNLNGQRYLASCLYRGVGVARNVPEAFRYFRLAADQGDISSQYNLGELYRYGDGVARNTEEAVRYYRLSANQSHSKAQFALGQCYEEGIGVEPDIGQAIYWYQLAADQIPAAREAHQRLTNNQ